VQRLVRHGLGAGMVPLVGNSPAASHNSGVKTIERMQKKSASQDAD
jgi:hypothetical protein